MALCYNLTRVLNIIGFDDFMARMAKLVATFQYALATVRQLLQIVPRTLWGPSDGRSAIFPIPTR
jgi:hypothetical protein